MISVIKRNGAWLALIAAITLVIAFLAGWGLTSGARAVFNGQKITGWGLSYPVPGGSSVGPMTADALRTLDTLYIGPPDEKIIYLTFDAGYENGFTPAILDTLKQHQAPACFFLVGHYLQEEPDLVRRMVSEGHLVANHTMNHYGMAKLRDTTTFQNEIQKFERLYTETVGGAPVKFYRPPEGSLLESNLRQAKSLGYTTVFWSLAYADWDNNKQPSPQSSLELLKKRIHPGAVILLHSTSRTNAQILDQLLTDYK
ncbi:MAG: polysaccharide deacetylase family protein, partial [Clostridia bacterium]|nr:polysaccharide deacetylase family protein [Clostridia bacterium]